MEAKRFKEEEEDELDVVACSDGRQQKGIAILRKKLARLLWTLRGLRKETKRDRLLMRQGAAKSTAGRAVSMVEVKLPQKEQEIGAQPFSFRVRKEKLAEAALSAGARKCHGPPCEGRGCRRYSGSAGWDFAAG